MNEQIIVTTISTLGGIIVTYLTVRYKDRIVKRSSPRDRTEIIFDGYDKLIKQQQRQQQQDIINKSHSIDQLERVIDHLERELTEARNLIAMTKHELEVSKQQNQVLIVQLEAMKLEYHESKTLPVVAP